MTYATSAVGAHEPSGRQARLAQSAWCSQATHVSALPQIGVVPIHAFGCSGVHCTQVSALVQTGVVLLHSRGCSGVHSTHWWVAVSQIATQSVSLMHPNGGCSSIPRIERHPASKTASAARRMAPP